MGYGDDIAAQNTSVSRPRVKFVYLELMIKARPRMSANRVDGTFATADNDTFPLGAKRSLVRDWKINHGTWPSWTAPGVTLANIAA